MGDLILLVVAFFSCISRSLINVIDRHQLCYRNENVIEALFLNSCLPTIVLIFTVLIFDRLAEFINAICTYETFFLGFIIHIVALIFSAALKKFHVFQVTLISKVSDVFIVIISWGLNFDVALIHITLHCLSFAISVPYFLKSCLFKTLGFYYCFFIVVALTFQGVVAPLLMDLSKYKSDLYDLIFFSLGTIFWRSVWASFILYMRENSFEILRLKITKVIALRVFLTLFTQLSFIYVISSMRSFIAMPILNLTGFFSIIFAGVFLGEKVSSGVFYLILLTVFLSGLSLYA